MECFVYSPKVHFHFHTGQDCFLLLAHLLFLHELQEELGEAGRLKVGGGGVGIKGSVWGWGTRVGLLNFY